MISIIENFDNSTDWSLSHPGINLFNDPIFIFDSGTSLRIDVPELMQDQFIRKIYPTAIDLSNFSEIRLQIMSRKSERFKFTKNTDFQLILELSTNGQPEIYKWYLPIYNKEHFNVITIDVSSLDSFDTITIRFNSNDADTFWIDYMISVEPEMEFDLLLAVSEKLNNQISIPIGNLANPAVIGDISILVTNDSFLTDGSLIKIEEDVISEFHQLGSAPENLSLSFTDLRDGSTIQNDFSVDAFVYLMIPADFRNVSKEIFLPGFSIWGFNPEKAIDRDDEVDIYFDFSESISTNVRRKRDSRNFNLALQITAESWSLEILQLMSKLLRSSFADDLFFQVGGIQINYEIMGSDFSFGENEEIPHSYIMTIEFYVFEQYSAGEVFKLSKDYTIETNQIDAGGL